MSATPTLKPVSDSEYKTECETINGYLESFAKTFAGSKVTKSEENISAAVAKYVSELNTDLLSATALDEPPHIGKPIALLDNPTPWFSLSTIADLGSNVDRVKLFDSRALSAAERQGTSTTAYDVNNFVKSCTLSYNGGGTEGLVIEIVDPHRNCAELLMLQYLTKRQKNMSVSIIFDFGWSSPKAVTYDGDTTVFFRDSVFGYLAFMEDKYDSLGQLTITLTVTVDTAKTLGILNKTHMQPYHLFAQNTSVYLGAMGMLKLVFGKIADVASASNKTKPIISLVETLAQYDVCSALEATGIVEATKKLIPGFPQTDARKFTSAFQEAKKNTMYRLDGFVFDVLSRTQISAVKTFLDNIGTLNSSTKESLIDILTLDLSSGTTDVYLSMVEKIRALTLQCATYEETNPQITSFCMLMRTVIGSCGARILIHPLLVAKMFTEIMTKKLNGNLGSDKVTIASPLFYAKGTNTAATFGSEEVTGFFSHVPDNADAYIHPKIGDKALSLDQYIVKLSTLFCSKEDYAKYGVDNAVYYIQPLNTWFDVLAAVFHRVYINMHVSEDTGEKLGLDTSSTKATRDKMYNIPIPLQLEMQHISLYGADGTNEALGVFTKRMSSLFGIVQAMFKSKTNKSTTVSAVSFKTPAVSATDVYATWYFGLLTVDNGTLLTQEPVLNRYTAAYSYRCAGGDTEGEFDPGHTRVWDVNFPDVVSFEPTFSLERAMITAGDLAKRTVKGMVAQGVTIDTIGDELKRFIVTLQGFNAALKDESNPESKRGEWDAILIDAAKLAEMVASGNGSKPVLDNFTYSINAQEHTSSVDFGAAMIKNQRDMQKLTEYMMLMPSGGFSVEGDLKIYGNPYFCRQSCGSTIFLKFINSDGTIGLLTGNYQITGITHTLDGGNFWTTFKLCGLCDRSAARVKDLYEHLYEKRSMRRVTNS